MTINSHPSFSNLLSKVLSFYFTSKETSVVEYLYNLFFFSGWRRVHGSEALACKYLNSELYD